MHWSTEVPVWVMALLLTILEPCPTEDSMNCTWDATNRGNTRGASFASLAMFGAEILLRDQ